MKRRQMILGLSGITGFGSLAFGTGAFTSVTADRTVSVAVADDDEAFLKLTQRGAGERSETDGYPAALELNIPGDDGDEYPTGNPMDPKGLGVESVYRFGGDAAGVESGLFAVENQGTQPVEIFSSQESTDGVPTVGIYNVNGESNSLLTEGTPSQPVYVGEKLVCGVEVDTHGVAIRDREYEVSLQINAVATEAND